MIAGTCSPFVPSRTPEAFATRTLALSMRWPAADAASWWFICIALWFALACAVTPARATEVPWANQRVDLSAENEPLNQFLLRFFARLRIPAIASELVTGKVSGRFNQRADVLFRELVDSYGLTWYFDGSTMHVYSLSESESRLLTLDPTTASRFNKLLADLKIADPRFPVQVANEGYVSVAGPPRFVQRVEEIAAFLEASLGRAGRPQAVRTFRLRHAWAGDRTINVGGTETVIPGVASLVQAVLNDASNSSAEAGGTRLLPADSEGLLGRGLAATGRSSSAAASGSAAPATGGATGGLATLSRPGVVSDAAATAAPRASNDPGRARVDGTGTIRPDPRLNAVVVRDSIDKMAMYEELIRSLDQPVPLVEIEATVVDISSDRSEALGTDFGLLLSNRPGRTSAPQISIQQSGFDPLSTPRATIVLGNDKNFFYAQLNALQQEGDATIESKPRVLTVDNNEAVLSSTQEFFVRVGGKDVVDLFNVSVGLTLRVTPSIVVEDEKVRFKLQVRIDDGSVSGTSSVDGVPLISRSAISASVIVDEGESLFIGGLTTELAQNGQRGVPGLQKVPVLGWLFGTTTVQTRKVQRMFLLTPRLVKGLAS